MSDFPIKAQDKTNSFGVIVIGLASTAIIWASVIALQAYFQSSQGDFAAERAAQGLTDEIRGLDAEQKNDLAASTYADRNKGTLKRLSLDHAMGVVVRDAAAGAPSLIPTLGLLNVATVPAVAGRPALTPPAAPAPAPAAPAPAGGAAPAEGAVPAGAPAPAKGAAPTGVVLPASPSPAPATPTP